MEILEDFRSYASEKRYSSSAYKVNPVHVIEWLTTMPRAFAKQLVNDNHFPAVLKMLMSESKYPMSIFINKNYLNDLLTDKPFAGKQFQQLFDVFLISSKLYATNHGFEILRELPDEFSSKSKAVLDTRFLTKVNECFKISVVISFYNWIPSTGFLETEELLLLIERYNEYLKTNFSTGKYKKMKIFTNFVKKFLSKSSENNIPSFELSTESNKVFQNFIAAKKIGLKIYNNGHLVNDLSWNRTTVTNNSLLLKQFLIKVAEKRGKEFSVYSININDFLEYQVDYVCNTLLANVLRQFVAFMLEQKTLNKSYKEALQELYLKIPANKALKKIKTRSISKVFISRKDYVRLIKTALQACEDKTRLKYACYIGLCGFCALRSVEVMVLQVSDFVLDGNLLIADLGAGYGRLNLDARKSKGGYSPSHPEYGIPIVPQLRNLLNLYLQSEHMKGYDESTFIMRTKPVCEEDNLFDGLPETIFADGDWLKKITENARDIMKRLYDKVEPYLDKYNGRISSHDLRRSINQYIKSSNSLVPQFQSRIAEIHLRHRKRGVNETSYTDDPDCEIFMTCINRSLNFPWDYQLLKEWEDRNLLKFNKRDWGTTNGYANYPNPIILENELSPKRNNDLHENFDIKGKEFVSKKEIELRSELNNLKVQLKEKNRNPIGINAKIMRLEKELLQFSNGGY